MPIHTKPHAFLHRIVGTERGYLVMEEVKTGARWTSTLTLDEFGTELLMPEECKALGLEVAHG